VESEALSAVQAEQTGSLQAQLRGVQMSSSLTRAIVGAALAIGALISFVVLQLGPTGFVMVTAPVAIVGLWGSSRIVEGRRRATNRLMALLVTTAFGLALIPLVSVMFTVIAKGLARFDLSYFSSDMRGVIGEGGGVLHALVGTIVISMATAAMSIPIGILTAVYLVEYGRGPLARWITILVDVMTGIPSIVAGLFAYALFEIFFGPGVRMGIGGAVALTVLMVPIVVRTTEEMLKLVPRDLREASTALGAPKWRTTVQVVLPAAASGISAGVIVAIARIIGETAPLLVIAGSTTNLNLNLFSGRMQTLPVFTYYSYKQPGFPPGASIDRAWTAALTLMLLVMLLNLVARLIARALAPKTA
jgi:phosphate transport system permease protein